jgi:hypothetical protein
MAVSGITYTGCIFTGCLRISTVPQDAKLLEIKRLAYLPENSRLHFAPSPDDYHFYTTAEGKAVRARTCMSPTSIDFINCLYMATETHFSFHLL